MLIQKKKSKMIPEQGEGRNNEEQKLMELKGEKEYRKTAGNNKHVYLKISIKVTY